MCPLRIILIFLSASLAGFFLLRNLNSQPNLHPDPDPDPDNDDDHNHGSNSPKHSNSLPLSSQVCGAIGKGFWTCVDMASGKYLWRHLVSSPSPSKLKRTD